MRAQSASIPFLPAAADDTQLLPYRAIDLFAASRQLQDVAVSDTSRRSMRKAGSSVTSAARSPYGRVAGGGRRGGAAAAGAVVDAPSAWWAQAGDDVLPQQGALGVEGRARDRSGEEGDGSSTVLKRRGAMSASATGGGNDTVWRMRGVVHAMLQAWNTARS